MKWNLIFNILIISCLLGGCNEMKKEVRCNDNNRCITLLKYRDEDMKSWTFIINGKFNGEELPQVNYAVVRNKWSEGWYLLADIKDDTMKLYEPYSYVDYEKSNLGNIKLQYLGDSAFFKIYYSSNQDSLLPIGSKLE